MADGGGSIGGGSVYVKFFVGKDEENATSKVELRDDTETSVITFTFPETVDLSKVGEGHAITVATEQLKETPVRIEWREGAAQRSRASAQSAG